mgnify:CR=1 FL=1
MVVAADQQAIAEFRARISELAAEAADLVDRAPSGTVDTVPEGRRLLSELGLYKRELTAMKKLMAAEATAIRRYFGALSYAAPPLMPRGRKGLINGIVRIAVAASKDNIRNERERDRAVKEDLVASLVRMQGIVADTALSVDRATLDLRAWCQSGGGVSEPPEPADLPVPEPPKLAETADPPSAKALLRQYEATSHQRPLSASEWSHVGQLLLTLGKRDQAAEAWRRAVASDEAASSHGKPASG